jgi:phage-related protein
LWLGSSRGDVRAFPRDARRLTGFHLRQVQKGLEPLDWKSLPTVGPSVREIRVHTALEHRVLYVTKFAEAVYVLHAFEKRSRKTARHDIELGRQWFRALMSRRSSESQEER